MHLRGLYVPLLTPLRPGGSLDLSAIRGHVDRLLANGVDGVVALGTTGEFADLTPDERSEVVAATIAAVDGRAPVLAGVGAVGTADACAHARAAEAIGADAVLSLPPLYWKLGEGGLFRHFATVTEATGLPVLLYDFPALAGTLSPALVDRVARELPSVVGIKLSGPELRIVHATLKRVKDHRPDFAILTGAADLVLPGLFAGTDGAIAAIANVTPTPLAAMLTAVAAGDVAHAVDCHRQVLRLLGVSALSTPPILALKAAAAVFGSPLSAVVRTLPDAPDLVVEQATKLAQVLRDQQG